MSAPEVAVLNAKVDSILISLNEMKEDYKKSNERLSSVETKVALLKDQHDCIQANKKDKVRPWYSVLPSIVSSLAALILAVVLALK